METDEKVPITETTDKIFKTPLLTDKIVRQKLKHPVA